MTLLYTLDIHSRKALILDMFEEKFGVPIYSLPDLQRSAMLGQIFTEVLPSFISDKEDNSHYLSSLFDQFIDGVSPVLEGILIADTAKQQNVFQMFNAASLSASNSLTRTFNTKLGLFWEDVANLSNNVISLENEFGLKLPGVDVVVLYDDELYFTQLKTQKNTLTGSQSGRVNEELGCFDHSWIVACIENNAYWTYSGHIQRLVGEEFWEKTTINYNEILYNLERTINHVEKLVTR